MKTTHFSKFCLAWGVLCIGMAMIPPTHRSYSVLDFSCFISGVFMIFWWRKER